MSKDNFRFYLPAELTKGKNTETGEEEMLVKGIASTASKDSQGEYLDPSGFDLSTFRWLNWNHLGKDDPSKIIGEPIRNKCKITAANEFYIEGRLYPEIDAASAAYKLMKSLKDSPMGNKLALSVEGKVIARDPKNPKRATKCRITSVALCPTPINGDTWVDLVQKGFIDTLEKSEEYDEDTQKILDSLIPEAKELRKSDIFERIVQEYPDVDQKTAQSIYNFILKTSTMAKENKVSEETLKKSFEFLGKAEDLMKAEAEKNKTEKGWGDNGKKAGHEDDEEEEDTELVKKATEKAKAKREALKKGWEENNKGAGQYDDKAEGVKFEIFKSLEKAGYGKSIAEKALKKAYEEKTEKGDDFVDRGEKTEMKKSIDTLQLQVAALTDLVKSQGTIIAKQFTAIGNVLEVQGEENAELKKSFEESLEANQKLTEDIEKVLSTPGQRRSVSAKSYSEKFEKSADGKKLYNISNPTDRKQLVRDITELSGLNKGEDCDKGLVKIAQELELMKSLSVTSLKTLEGHDIKVMVSN